jgi:hypothetical protein
LADTWVPVDENAFSDYVTRHLRDDLEHCGIVALREVEIRRGNDGTGERTDVYVTAVILGPMPETFETVRVIVEVKGCWHAELQTAMETQLKDRYLKDNDCEHGIYLVGWFACDSWDSRDKRKRRTPRLTFEEATDFFAKQSTHLSDGNSNLKSYVLNASLV